MAKTGVARYLIFGAVFAFVVFHCLAADVPDNLISNGGFEAGMQIWKGDGKIVLLPDGNRVCELDASKSRMKDLKQEFHLRQLQQVEVIFRARSINYTGPGIRISIHQLGGGSLIWNRDLPPDGSWRQYRILYTRTTAANDLRELNIATLLGSGQVQIDDVEVREPSKLAREEPPEPAPPPPAPPVPETKPSTPFPIAKLPPPPFQPVPAKPANQPPAPDLPPGTFGSLEQIINSAPPDALQKLQNSATVDAGITEINDYLSQSIKGKPAQFHLTAAVAEPVAETRNKFRIRAPDHLLTNWSSGNVKGRIWFYFPDESAPPDGKVAVGTDVHVSGVIGRCDLTNKGALQLNVDVQRSKLLEP